MGSLSVLYVVEGLPHVLRYRPGVHSMQRQLDLVLLVEDAGHRADHHSRTRPEGLQQLQNNSNSNE